MHSVGLWKQLMRVLLIICLIFALADLSVTKDAQWAAESPRISKRLAAVLADADATIRITSWVYVDSSAVAVTPVTLSAKSLNRRSKADPAGFLIDEKDYPIALWFLDSVTGTGAEVLSASRWLKAVAVDATVSQLQAVLQMPAVTRLDLAQSLYRTRPPDSEPVAVRRSVGKAAILPYGPTALQNQFINAVKLHEAGLSGDSVMIALFDSGFETGLQAFNTTSIIATYNFIDNTPDVTGIDCSDVPQNRHGTQVLGVIGGFIPDTIIGTAYGADFLLAKTEITCGGTEIKVEEYNWIAAAEWADSAGADIISASLGYTQFEDSGSYTQSLLNGDSALITQAADAAAAKNILMVNSAGNERLSSWGTISFPADGDSVLAVGAVTSDLTLASFSSPGPTVDGRIKPDIVALGVSVVTVNQSGDMVSVSGTSFAAPLTTGGAALAFEHDRNLTADELRQLVRNNGSKADNPDNNFGYGLFNAARSADIIQADPISPINLRIGESQIADLTSSGRSDSIPILTLAEATPGVTLTDFGDGTGQLQLMGLEANLGSRQVGVVADVGYFADTNFFILNTIAARPGTISAGPNPFQDTVAFFFDSVGTVNSVSIFNSAGELVWDKVNVFGQSTDVIVWDGRNTSGLSVAAGVYVAVIETNKIRRLMKLLKF
jgi:hypothetical protein